MVVRSESGSMVMEGAGDERESRWAFFAPTGRPIPAQGERLREPWVGVSQPSFFLSHRSDVRVRVGVAVRRERASGSCEW